MSRFAYLMTAYFATMVIIITAFITMPLRLVWNASASTPIGLYEITPADRLEVADLVAVTAPEPLATFMHERGYLPRGVPLMKRVVALPGQTVCRTGRDVLVDGAFIAAALDRDREGRELPVWQGCRIIAKGQLFLMNWQVQDSLDGRYFGPLPDSSVLGRAVPLWTDEDGSGRYEWRAPTR
ncbi:S26 family signal peptidase [Sinorhizobium garamanticum]|uniref:S26 family signal peptidase n=1 Tax=Sinorhizobium garamanticum TaxID=680247 RepID=A0ABY8D7Z2_9HYPH|nr:S26 family signal peptidase [Sinorhizobium garamanticum]WEX85772.1 S26 family signal peptidase [Sinorhizobium garamanticum]